MLPSTPPNRLRREEGTETEKSPDVDMSLQNVNSQFAATCSFNPDNAACAPLAANGATGIPLKS